MKTSIVITTFNRPTLLHRTLNSFFQQNAKDFEVIVVDDGTDTDTAALCHSYNYNFPVNYIKMRRPQNASYKNPALPNNVGIRAAKGEIVILQNAECMHDGEVISKLTARVQPRIAVFASVAALNEDGSFQSWYTHSKHRAMPFFFCGAIYKERLTEIRGFDEDYKYYGYDDNDMGDRLERNGVFFEYHDDITVLHQWHGWSFNPSDNNNNNNAEVYHRKTSRMKSGLIGVERNLGREWGQNG